MGDGGGGQERVRRRAVQNENEKAESWTGVCDLLQIEFCKLAFFFWRDEG